MEVTAHRAAIKRCPGCGRQVVAEFPAEVKQVVQYGPRVCSSVIYLKDHALLPYGRLRQLMKDLLGYASVQESWRESNRSVPSG
jgi:transposase